MATETRAGHIRMSDPTFEERVGHGRMGYRCVYGRVMWPWFAKGWKSAQDYPMANIPCSAMHNSQCGLVHRKAGWCTKEPSDGIWYGKGSPDVQKCLRMAFGTGETVLVYQRIIGWHLVHQTGLSGTEARTCPESKITARRAPSNKGFCTKSTYSVRNEIRCRFIQHYRRFVKLILWGIRN